jgi:5'-methylthioinosine phosphorylase
MNSIAIIGGSGCYGLPNHCPYPVKPIQTPFGVVSGILSSEEHGTPLTHAQPAVYFLPRHGQNHAIAPHKINYRANIWALKFLNVDKIVAINAVGSIISPPGTWLIPRQIIDYTYGREHTFFDDFGQGVQHIEFTEPLNTKLINALSNLFNNTALHCVGDGIYGCTQGPRLETAAEIHRLERDGCTMVGMTLMPEAALAAELSMAYASLCLSVNWAAGKCSTAITFEAIKMCLETEHARLSIYWPLIIDLLIKLEV